MRLIGRLKTEQKEHVEVVHGLVSPARPIGSIIVPFCGLYLRSYKTIPKTNYNGACMSKALWTSLERPYSTHLDTEVGQQDDQNQACT